MADRFFDTSAFAEHYRAELGTAKVDAFLAETGSRHFISPSASSSYIRSSPAWSAAVRSPPPISTWRAGGSSPTSPLVSGKSCRSLLLICITLSNCWYGRASAVACAPSMPSSSPFHS